MEISVRDIAASISSGSPVKNNLFISQLLTDSRQLLDPSKTLFFAIAAHRRDGHDFISELYQKGVRNFVITRKRAAFDELEEANFLEVHDSLKALQDLAAWHRSKFKIPVIGITGSNGKTIVKEWLYQLLQEDYNIVRSPKSYNSQIGVPLSVWQMQSHHDLAIFEAGISRPGEMERLEKIIQPTIGVFTGLGEPHSEGFSSAAQKLEEKMKLFKNTSLVVGGSDNKDETLTIKHIRREGDSTIIEASHTGQQYSVSIPFTDEASISNAMTCWKVLRVLGVPHDRLSERMKRLQPVSMRLELKKGRNGCILINDSYSADLSSLGIALDFMEQQKNDLRKTVILSDFLESSREDDELYRTVINNLVKHNISRLVGIGPKISEAMRRAGSLVPMSVHLFDSTEEMLKQFRTSIFRDEIILVKGARIFEFERIVQVLEQKTHQTILEIDLNAIAHNLKQFQSRLQPGTKVMAMVKAFAYGSGGAEIAGILQYHKVEYLGVAYADEGVELRKAGIHVPIMVMNPEPASFHTLVDHLLEPEIYSFPLLNAWEEFLEQQAASEYPIHIEIETGMNRLGFERTVIGELGSALLKGRSRVRSVFSHFAASEDEGQDEFTRKQFERFTEAADALKSQLGYDFLRHIANTAGIVRHPYSHLDMVRLGIGMYGIEQTGREMDLQVVATLRSTIAQVKELEEGESVSYNRREVLNRKSRIATVRIGYADGIPRRLGNGKGKVWVRGKLAPIVGAVCMDMIMIDVTDIPGVIDGDDVVLFGRGLTVQELSSWADTIPYEILTGISQRVKRVYFLE